MLVHRTWRIMSLCISYGKDVGRKLNEEDFTTVPSMVTNWPKTNTKEVVSTLKSTSNNNWSLTKYPF